jgi:transcriptional regulator GlxA family with amidase domain
LNKKATAIFTILTGAWLQALAYGQTPTAAQNPIVKTNPTLVKVAFVVTERFNLLDVAGAWSVFSAAAHSKPGKKWEEGDRLFQTYLVSDTIEALHSTAGMLVTPAYTFKDAPKPDVVVVGAQNGNPPELYDWLKKENAEGVTIMSVCVGVVKLANLGILDGKNATTHHDYIDRYEEAFPKVHWLRNRRYVRSTDNVLTSGGDGISGIDLALHLVDLRFGRTVAQGTADYLEYHSDEWKQDDRVAQTK